MFGETPSTSMKIKTKIIGSFLLVFLIIAIATYFFVEISMQALEKEIGSSSAISVGETIHRIDRSIYRRVVEWQVRKETPVFQETIKKSNAEFDSLNNIQQYIDAQDKQWTSVPKEEITAFISELMNNSLSQSMKKVLDVYKEKYGYMIFSEVFVTNKYGANVAQTDKTTDFRQDDEEWWKQAKENNLYAGDLMYDESANSYSMDLAIRVDGENGNFIGVIDAALNINETAEIINEVKELERERNLEFKLLNKDGKIIHSTQNFTFLETFSPGIFSKINSTLTSQKGYFITGENNSELVAYARSRGYNEFGGLGWILMSTQNTEKVLAPVAALRNIIFLITIIVLILSILIVYFICRSIINSTNKLRGGIEVVEKGNLKFRLASGGKDEMGELSRFFNKMTESLEQTNIEIHQKVKEQTKDIENKRQVLENQQSAILNVLEDVEKEKEKTEKEKDKINAILQGIGEGVFVVDNNLRIILFNPAASKISGFSEDEIAGKRYDKVLKFIYEKNEQINNVFIKKTLETGEIFNALNHTLLLRKDGEKIPVSTSAAPLKDQQENTAGCVVVFRDVITERNIDKAKSEFVSIASHQLRTPLTGIKWFIELLMKGKAGKFNKKQLDFLQQIFISNERMIALVNDLLNVSRLEVGAFTIEPKDIDLAVTIEAITKELAPLAKGKKIQISKNFDKNIETYHADPKLLEIIFQNLLSNAIKYTPQNGKISIKLEKTKTDILFSISDTGIGIPKNQHSQVFTKLFRADNVKQTSAAGTGLGLYIAKTIIENSNGKIWFKSPIFENEQNYKGTAFYFTLPLGGMKKKAGTKELA